MRRALAALPLVAAAIVLPSTAAEAYCLTSTCSGGRPGQLCVPAQSDDCGSPLYWSSSCVGYSIHEGGSSQVSLGELSAIIDNSFATWRSADCGGGATPNLDGVNLDPVACDAQEYNQNAGNVNLIVVRDGTWPYQGLGRALALTTLTYNLDTGEIFDADLEINGTVNLTTSHTDVEFDLRSVLVHEVGHILGLAHSSSGSATMTVEYTPGEIELRTLESDDISAICSAYPPDDTRSCEPTPRRGLKETCGDEADDEGGCSVAEPAASDGRRDGFAWLALALLAGLVGRRRWS